MADWRPCCAANCPTTIWPALEQRLTDADSARARAPLVIRPGPCRSTRRGDYARAADCLRQANAITLELSQRPPQVLLRPDHEQFVDMPVRQFRCATFSERLAGAGLDSRRPVFVFGLPRSGTTLDRAGARQPLPRPRRGELRLARQIVRSAPRRGGPAESPRDCVPHLDAAATLGSHGNISTAWPALDGGQRRADRGQDARQLHVSRLAWPPCFPRPFSFTAAATCATSPSRAG